MSILYRKVGEVFPNYVNQWQNKLMAYVSSCVDQIHTDAGQGGGGNTRVCFYFRLKILDICRVTRFFVCVCVYVFNWFVELMKCSF